MPARRGWGPGPAPKFQRQTGGHKNHPNEIRIYLTMDDNLPLIFTPLVRQPGVPIPDWLFGPAGVAGLPAPLNLPQGVNVAIGIDIIEVDRVRKVYEHHCERFLKRGFTEMEVPQWRDQTTRPAGRLCAQE